MARIVSLKQVFSCPSIKEWVLIDEDKTVIGSFTYPEQATDYAEKNNLILDCRKWIFQGIEYASRHKALEASNTFDLEQTRRRAILKAMPEAFAEDSMTLVTLLSQWDKIKKIMLEE